MANTARRFSAVPFMVSIIMPTYNVEAFISKAIDSVLSQSFQDWELIVVDDGSPDNSAAIAGKYAEKDIRIKVVHKPNGGLSDARNYGLQFATGDYIHFFDPDDYLAGEFYRPMLDAISKEKADVVIAGHLIQTINKNDETKTYSVICPVEGNESFSFHSMAQVTKFVCFAWNKLFRREFIRQNNLQYEKGLSRIEDAEFMSRLIAFNPRIVFLKHSEYVYVHHNGQTLSKGFDDNMIGICNRRESIDFQLIKYFAQIPEHKHSFLKNNLRSLTIVFLINRIYETNRRELTRSRSHYLNQIKKLYPDKFITNRSGLKLVFDRLLAFSLKFKLYWLLSLIQKLRSNV